MNVTLRDWEPDDARELATLANDRRIWLNLRDAAPSILIAAIAAPCYDSLHPAARGAAP